MKIIGCKSDLVEIRVRYIILSWDEDLIQYFLAMLVIVAKWSELRFILDRKRQADNENFV